MRRFLTQKYRLPHVSAMGDGPSASPPCLGGAVEAGCAGEDHAYCHGRAELARECVCQRWMTVEYYGDVVVSPEAWRRCLAEMLGGIDCEVMGCEVVDEDPTTSKSHAPVWHFMIYRRIPSDGREVMHRLGAVDFAEEVPKLGDWKSGCDGCDRCEGSHGLHNSVRIHWRCCSHGLVSFASTYLAEGAVTFSTSEGPVTSILRNEWRSYLSYSGHTCCMAL